MSWFESKCCWPSEMPASARIPLICNQSFSLRNLIRAAAKRLLDISLAVAALLISAPALVAIAIAVRLDSAGSPLYKGKRVGRFARPFNLIKFRTMVPDADRAGPLVTAAGDPRVTRLGRFLRRTKLDELPSLWNVVKGDMSLVGPRPENERSAALYNADQRAILSMRPGITSFATLKYRHEESLLASALDLDEAYFRIMQDKLGLDLEYMKRQSISLDLKILYRTGLALFQ
jgi:lipopolysaccharide/colanic/teichoic acid biosynthesis glycosyltransferase